MVHSAKKTYLHIIVHENKQLKKQTGKDGGGTQGWRGKNPLPGGIKHTVLASRLFGVLSARNRRQQIVKCGRQVELDPESVNR